MSRIQWNRSYSLSDCIADANDFAKRYPGIVSVKQLGCSEDGRPIILCRVGNQKKEKGKKQVLCCAGVHGREYINPMVLMKMLEQYAAICAGAPTEKIGHFFWKQKIKRILQKHEIAMIPLLNPDGYTIAQEGYDCIQDDVLRVHAKSLQIPYEEWKYNARGIDLNRNFPSVTRGKHAVAAASERETRILLDVFQAEPWIGFLDYHSRGECIYYYRQAMHEAYNRQQKKFAKQLRKITGYVMMPKAEEVDLQGGGNTVHAFSEQYNYPALTIETVPEGASFPLDLQWQERVYQKIVKTPFVFF